MAGATQAGNNPQTDFFKNANINRVALVPGALSLATFANKGQNTNSATRYNSLVRGSQQNGSGPAVAPINASFSFTQFATGIRTLAVRRVSGKKR